MITPDVLYSEVVEVNVRVIPALAEKCKLPSDSWKRVRGTTGQDLFVIEDLDENQLSKDLARLKQSGIESLAVVLMHSYT